MATKPKDARPHIIVVEDEQFQRETLVDFLGENGYRASGVESGAALRRLVEKDPPALVLLDLRLPGGEDGFTLARFLRERSRRMGIIMVTASGDTVDQVVGLETGADDYIAKPYESRALLARMKAVLRRAGGATAATRHLISLGHTRIRLFPLFLGMGKHAREDLPELVQNLRDQHPSLELHVMPSAGEQPQVLDLLAQVALQRPTS